MSLLSWVNAVQDETVIDLKALKDAVVLSGICLRADPAFFAICHDFHSNANAPVQWRSLALLVERWFTQILRAALPDDISSSLEDSIEDMVSVVLALTVQSERKDLFVDKILSLPPEEQEDLMKRIESITSSLRRDGKKSDIDSLSQEELRSRLRYTLNEKDLLQLKLRSRDSGLVNGYHLEDSSMDKEDVQEADLLRKEKLYKQEVDRLTIELHTSQDELTIAEESLRNQTTQVASLEASLKETQDRAEEAERLKDQLDEYKHASDKLSRAENALEKYKKKLEDAADLRLSIKSLEEENANLVDRNAHLEEDLSKLTASKSMLDSYKSQISALETKLSQTQQDAESLRFQLEQTSAKLQIAEEERARDGEAVELYEERIKEMESAGNSPAKSKSRKPTQNGSSTSPSSESENDDSRVVSFADSISGTSMTQLRLQVKRLARELKEARSNKADASRVIVLENLLQDANAARTRYETEFLNERREVLKLRNVLEEIRSGKADADSPEVVLALRHRLNEVSSELDALKQTGASRDVDLDRLRKDLTVAQSNLKLVNKDQLDIIASLRASVSEEKNSLAAEVEELKASIKAAEEKAKLQASQINKLLLDKIDLQSDSIAQRERMLQGEQTAASLRKDWSNPALKELNQKRLADLEQDLKTRSEEILVLQSKLDKARDFIKDQDALAKEKYTSLASTASQAEVGELKQQLQKLETDLEKALSSRSDADLKNRKEQQLMVQAWQKIGFDRLTTRDASGSWLRQQRYRGDN